jgi:hypothetical protein
MLPRWARLMVAFAAAIAVWAIATPAWASAPLCDPHGATGIAPPPQLQQPETSIDTGVAAEDCSELIALTTSFDNGRAPEPAPPSASQEPLAASAAPASAGAGVTGSIARDRLDVSERAGARSRVDRPPRT